MASLTPLSWSVGFTADPAAAPTKMVPASVPGAVQLDWARAHDWPDHNHGDNFKQYAWMEDVYWLYRAALPALDLAPDHPLYFVCGGVDYRCQVRVGGRVLHEQEGMFTPIEIDLTGRAKAGDVLEVLVWPAPKSQAEPANRDQANQSCKPAVSYGWDFHPRLIPLGIWDETGLERRPACHIASCETSYTLSDALDSAEVRLAVHLSTASAGALVWKLSDPDGRIVAEVRGDRPAQAVMLPATITSPRLWWPNGQGEAPLYRSTVELLDAAGRVVQTRSARIGLRRVRLVMHPEAWREPANFPKGRSTPPITMEVNGRRIFCKGSNWVSPDIFPGPITADTYRAQLNLVKAAHMNMLRCWGGAPVQKEAFFDLCDELGIMVWQEFPLACNRYEGTPHYLRILDQESRSIIRRLRPHAAVVLWCGGNELFNAWSRMTDQDLALRLLNRNTFDLDPSRPFLPTAPVMGMAHGSYGFKGYDDGKEVYERFGGWNATAYTEFGVNGYSTAQVVRRILPAADLGPRDDGQYQSERGFNMWSRNRRRTVEEYFGPQASLEEWTQRSLLLQGEGLKFIFEEARRQWPRCSMALSWCLNEPWPAVGNLSIINWPCEPKPSYQQVVQACRPVVASARLSRFRWKTGQAFCPELWLLNDSPDTLPPGRIEAALVIGSSRIPLLAWDHPGVGPCANLAGPRVHCILPEVDARQMELVLDVKDHPERSSRYILLYEPTEVVPARRMGWSLSGQEWLASPGMPVERPRPPSA